MAYVPVPNFYLYFCMCACRELKTFLLYVGDIYYISYTILVSRLSEIFIFLFILCNYMMYAFLNFVIQNVYLNRFINHPNIGVSRVTVCHTDPKLEITFAK